MSAQLEKVYLRGVLAGLRGQHWSKAPAYLRRENCEAYTLGRYEGRLMRFEREEKEAKGEAG